MIDWKKAGKALCLKGQTLAEMAGVSDGFWSMVKHGKRGLHPNAEKLLLLRLAIHFNINNKGDALRELLSHVDQLREEFQEKFPREG